MARELHDTLEQNLTGISLSLEAANLTLAGAPQMAEQHLTRALGQVDASIEEVHRAVWALREASLAARGLGDALDEIGQQLASCSARPIEVRTSVAGQPRPFAVAVENNLLRIGQEALTNAVKHGKATHIGIDLRYDAAGLLLVRERRRLRLRHGRRGRARPFRPRRHARAGAGDRRAAGGARGRQPRHGSARRLATAVGVPASRRLRDPSMAPSAPSASWSSTIIRSSARGWPPSSAPRPTCASSARPPTATRRSPSSRRGRPT